MKQIKLSVLLLLCATCTFAQNGNSLALALSLTKLTPYLNLPEEVQKEWGVPSAKESYKDQSVWKYEVDKSTEIIFYWDTRINRLRKYSFICHSDQRNNMRPQSQSCKLETGTTAVADAITLLGAPYDMMIGPDTQQLNYQFKDNVVNLYFRRGHLLRVQINGLEHKA